MTNTNAARWSPTGAELAHALEHEEFTVYYQPIVELSGYRLAGAEALVRWQHPQRGLLSPSSFVEAAEAAGLGAPLTEWVQWAACRQAQAWLAAGLDLPVVSINITPEQFKPGYLAPHLRALLDETGLDPRRLAVEIHEIFMPDHDTALTVLAELAGIGIPLWSDDFGTGPSAVPYLAHFPFAVLKIDREFIWGTPDNAGWVRTVTGLIGFAHHLGLRVIGEGVRTAAQLAFLHEHGCDMIQGGYFSLPVPAETITALLRSGGTLAPIPRISTERTSERLGGCNVGRWIAVVTHSVIPKGPSPDDGASTDSSAAASHEHDHLHRRTV